MNWLKVLGVKNSKKSLYILHKYQNSIMKSLVLHTTKLNIYPALCLFHLICNFYFYKLKISCHMCCFFSRTTQPFRGNSGPQCNTVFATLENCGEINNSGFIIMIANGFRDDLKADNMVQVSSPSVSFLSREIGLHHFLFLSWSKWQVAMQCWALNFND